MTPVPNRMHTRSHDKRPVDQFHDHPTDDSVPKRSNKRQKVGLLNLVANTASPHVVEQNQLSPDVPTASLPSISTDTNNRPTVSPLAAAATTTTTSVVSSRSSKTTVTRTISKTDASVGTEPTSKLPAATKSISNASEGGELSPDTSRDSSPTPAVAGSETTTVTNVTAVAPTPTASPPPTAEEGGEPKYLSTVGHYKLIKAVECDGSSSRNYQCLDTITNEILQCKVMKPEKFQILQKAAARLSADRLQESTKNIVARIIPTESKFIRGQIANTNEFQYYWFYQESRGDLHSYVRDSKGLTEQEARLFFRQMVETIAFCHSRGIILRDLKLRKFVFADEKKTKLRFESLDDIVVLDNQTDDILQERHGCPAYVAPELLVPGKPKWSGRQSDVWSLGIILFVMLIGRYPFHDPNAVILFRKIRNDRLFVPERAARAFRMPAEVLVLIKGILRKTPTERPTALDILAHPWLTPKRRYGYGTAPQVSYTANGIVVPLQERNDQLVPCMPEEEEKKPEAEEGSGIARRIAELKAMVAREISVNGPRSVDYDSSDLVPNIDSFES